MLDALRGVVRGVTIDPPDAEECRRAALGARIQHAASCDTYAGQAETLAFYEAIGGYGFGVEYEDAILTVGPDDLLDLATRFFDPDAALAIRTHERRPNP